MKNKTPIPQPRSPSKSSTTFKNIVSEKEHGFTLIELIVVIIIVGILAAVGISQYSATVEKSRLAEAKIRIGAMRKLAQEYYLNNGTMTGVTDADLGADNTCTSNSFYRYTTAGVVAPTDLNMYAIRCTSGGKTPNVSRQYQFFMNFYPSTGGSLWRCTYIDDGSSCFGYPI